MTTPFESGSPGAPICFLAEAPSYAEVAAGAPLVGPAGKLFDQCLNFAGIKRSDCYILNVFPWQVKKPKDNLLVAPDGMTVWSNGKFTDYGWECAGPQIGKLIVSHANVVAPLGGVALSAVYDSHQIGKWRGSILNSTMHKKLVPTYHPAASLRGQYVWRYIIINDMKRVKEESASAQINLPERELVIAPQFLEVCKWLKHLQNERLPACLDIEILNDQISCISFSNDPKLSISIPFVDEHGNYFTTEQEAEIWYWIATIIEDGTIPLVNQNLVFDLAVIFQRYGIIPAGPMHDPMIAHHIMFPDFPKGLDFLCSTLTREPYYKDEGKIWKNLTVSFEDHWRYNAKDAAVALECWQALEADMDDEYRQLHDFTTAMYPALIYMMSRGIKVDAWALGETNEEIKIELVKKQEKLNETADYPFNPLSPKQVMGYFYDHLGIKPYIGRKTHAPTADDTAMSRITRRFPDAAPIARLVQEIRNLNKLHSTYLDVEYDSDQRLRCSYNPRGTRFSRLSSSETVFGTGLNMQNLDSRFKRFLVAG